MCVWLALFVINFFQVLCIERPHLIYERSPQQFDIQSIRQKQVSPDITVVDVVVNEPTRNGYRNRNQFIQPIYQPNIYQKQPNNFNYNPNRQYQNIATKRRQPEIQIIEVVDPNLRPTSNFQPWQKNPGGNLGNIQPTYPNIYPGERQEQFFPNYPGRYPGNRNGPPRRRRPNRRPYRPTPDFYVTEDDLDDNLAPTSTPTRDRSPINYRPKPNITQPSTDDSEEEEEKYIFDQGENTVVGYTKDNFPIVNLTKNDIRR